MTVIKSNDSYEDDDFENISVSKSIQPKPVDKKPIKQVQEEITCFECNLKILKSQAGAHRKVCTKSKKSKTRKSMELSSERNSDQKYSPIHESKHGEDDSSSQYTSVQESESQSLPRQTVATRKHQISVAPPTLSNSGNIKVNNNTDLKGIENTGSVATEENDDHESESSYTISATASVSQSDANTKALWNSLAKKYLNKGDKK